MRLVCPHCQSPVEVVDLALHVEIACPSCGSSFRLEGGDATTDWTPLSGKKLGRFELIQVLGHGAFGTVYRARDPELDRDVAIKVPRAGSLGSDGKDADRFLREARSAAQLRHPGIVTVHEVGQHDGVPYLVSDFVEGVTVADRLSAGGITAREAAEIIAAAAEALDYAHQMGVVHRDVKPSNLMLEIVEGGHFRAGADDGKPGSSRAVPGDHAPSTAHHPPKIMDFGLAKRDAGEITMTVDGQVLGTPAYMSPEQARGQSHAVDGRSDVYSLGVILYQMLTGELPFRGTARMLLHQVLHDEPRPPRKLNDKIPRDLQTVCLKCLAKEPARRYPSAGALAADLRRFLAGEPVQARPVGTLERAGRWARRNPVVAGLLAAIVLVTAVGFAATLWQMSLALDSAEQAQKNENLAKERENEAKQKQEELRLALYAADMGLIPAAWEGDNVERVVQLLNRHRPGPGEKDMRGFEWHYWNRLANSHLQAVTLDGGRQIYVLSPDATLVAAGDLRGADVKVWDARTGKLRWTLSSGQAGPDDVRHSRVAFSPEGDKLAAMAQSVTYHTPDRGPALDVKSESMVTIWDVATGKKLWSRTGTGGSENGLALGPGGKLLAVASHSHITLWDTTTDKLLHKFAGGGGEVIAFSADGKQLAAPAGFAAVGPPPVVAPWLVEHTRVVTAYGLMAAPMGQGLFVGAHTLTRLYVPPDHSLPKKFSLNRVRVWDTTTGKELKTIATPGLRPRAVAFSSDGKRLAVLGDPVGKEKSCVQVHDLDTGKQLIKVQEVFHYPAPPTFSPDGKMLACRGAGLAVRLWDVATGKEKLVLRGHALAVTDVVFDAGGRFLYSAGLDQVVKKWDIAPRPPVAVAVDERLWFQVAGPDGTLAVVNVFDDFGGPGHRYVREMATGKNLLALKNYYGAAFHPDGRQLAVIGKVAEDTWAIQMLKLPDGEEVLRLALPLPRGERPSIANLDFSTEGRYLAALNLPGKTPPFGSVQNPFRILVWDTQDRKVIFDQQGQYRDSPTVAGVALAKLSTDARLVAWGARQEFMVWDVKTGAEIVHRKVEGDVAAVAFDPEGKRLATVINHRDKQDEVVVWDVASDKRLVTFRGHSEMVTGVCFSPDGTRIASCTGSTFGKGDIKVWDAATGQELLNLPVETGFNSSIQFTSDGHKLLCVRSVETGSPLLIFDATPLPGHAE